MRIARDNYLVIYDAMQALPAPDEHILDHATYILSEWINDNAPIDESHYRDPAEALLRFAALAYAQPAPAPDEFKPCIVVHEEIAITEAVFEDVPYIAKPIFPGVYHWIDKHEAMDDGRLVGMKIWATKPPAPDEAGNEALERAVQAAKVCSIKIDTAWPFDKALYETREQIVAAIRALKTPSPLSSERDEAAFTARDVADARNEGRTEERAAVVAWLISSIEISDGKWAASDGDRKIIAAAIARSDHLLKTGGGR